MADRTVTTPTPKKSRRGLKLIGGAFGIVLVLVVVAYFVGTSSTFFKSVILPRVGKAMNAEVTVSDASISPFSQVVLRNLKVQTTGSEPLLTAPEVRVRYSLMDIIGGSVNVSEMAVSSPTVVLIQNPDGSSNLDPILESQEENPDAGTPGADSEPMKVDIKRMVFTEGTVRQITLDKGGNRDVTELSKANFTIENVKNGQPGTLTLSADARVQSSPPAPEPSGLLLADIKGSFDFALTQDLMPASLKGSTRLEVTRAEGSMAQLARLAGELDCDVTPTEIRQAVLRFQQGNTPLGQVRANGPFNMEKTEGRLRVEVAAIDKQLLNLAGASSGIDFGTTSLNSSNEVEIAKSGSVITTVGRLDVDRLQLIRTNQSTPTLDLHSAYNVTVDTTQSNAVLRAFTLNGAQGGRPLLRGELTSPMTVSWGNVSNAMGDSALNLILTNFNLADWKPFLGDTAPAGIANGQLKLLSQQGGKKLTYELNTQVDNLTVLMESNQLTQAGMVLQFAGTATDLKQYQLAQYRFQLARQGQPLLTASGSGVYDVTSENGDFQITAQAVLARLAQLAPQPDLSVSSGTAELKARLVQKDQTQTVVGNLALADLSARFGDTELRGFGSTVDMDVAMTPKEIQIRKLVGAVSEGGKPGGNFDLTGTYGLSNQAAQITAKLANFNQNGLRAFLEPLIGDKRLVSVAMNANANVQRDPEGASSVKANLQVANLVVNDPKNQFPATPLEAKLLLDASLRKQVADIRQFQVALTPTARATNQVEMTGQVDMTQTNVYQGNLKLAADSLDLTRYYDLFAGDTKASEKQTSTPSPQPGSATPAPGPEKEPEATKLPFRNFVADASIRRLYLREVEVADFQTTLKLDEGRVLLNPFKLLLNGAPVSTTMDFDMGVPGYKYDLAFSAQAIPLTPLVNSFQPEHKGQVGGALTGQAKITGAGTTGASLQKSLKGSFDLGSTNLNLSVVHAKNPLLRTLINVVAMIPDLVRNPDNAVGSLLSALTQKPGAGAKGGLASELEQSPIDEIIARGTMGGGQVSLDQAVVRSPAFEALARGSVTLAPVLTNSAIQIPVSISLSRSLAQRASLLPPNTPTNAAYAKLPDFVTLKGTVGNPKTDINKLALAGTLLKGVGGALPNESGQAGQLIQSLGGLLGGGTSAAASTNAPAAANTNRPANPLGGLLQGILGGATATNTARASTNQPATNQSPVGDLLNELLGPKKN